MSDEAIRMARAEQASTALKEFLGPAFDVCRADYLEKLGEVAARPLTNDIRAGMEKLALGVKVLDEVRRQIEGLVRDGDIARECARRASDLAELPAEKKRWLGY